MRSGKATSQRVQPCGGWQVPRPFSVTTTLVAATFIALTLIGSAVEVRADLNDGLVAYYPVRWERLRRYRWRAQRPGSGSEYRADAGPGPLRHPGSRVPL